MQMLGKRPRLKVAERYANIHRELIHNNLVGPSDGPRAQERSFSESCEAHVRIGWGRHRFRAVRDARRSVVAGSDLNQPGRNRRHDLAAQKTAWSVTRERYPDSPMTIRKEHDRSEEHCAKRATLSQSVSNAITEAYLRKKAVEDAKAKNEDTILLRAAFQPARDALAKAVDALRKHIEEHGCKK
jgi:hypothetical protein